MGSDLTAAGAAVDPYDCYVFKVYEFDKETSCWGWTTSRMSNRTASEEKTIKRSFFLQDGFWCWDKAPNTQKQEKIDPIEVFSLDEETNEWVHTSTLVYSQHESSGGWAWNTMEVPKKQKLEHAELINEVIGTQKKVYALQVSTGTYGWEIVASSGSPTNESSNTTEVAKEYSLHNDEWGWRQVLGNSLPQVTKYFPVITPLKNAPEKVQESAPTQASTPTGEEF